jgi:hypothetical protein
VYNTTHRCVEWPCFTEAKSVPPSRDYTEEIRKGPRKGHFQIARPPPREHRGQRERRRTRPWSPWKLRAGPTDCADCARRSGGRDASGEVKRPPLNGYFLTSARAIFVPISHFAISHACSREIAT